MRLFYFLIFCFYSFNALANSCESWNTYAYPTEGGEATIIVNTEQVHLNEIKVPLQNVDDLVLADSMDIEFWVEQCVIDDNVVYSLFGTVTPTVPGKSVGALFYDVAVIQNNKQYDQDLSFSDNFYIPSNFFARIATYSKPENAIYTSFSPEGFDLSQPFTLILSCNSSVGFYYVDCIAVNSDKYFEINPQSGIDNTVISSVNGAWYDPEYNGSGFNTVQTPGGFIMYYYGYKAGTNGEALWLTSSTGPKTIKKDETFTLDMYSGFIGNGGSLTTKPTTQNSGIQIWGTAEITFSSCNSGEITLTSTDDITVSHNIILLAGIDGLTCE